MKITGNIKYPFRVITLVIVPLLILIAFFCSMVLLRWDWAAKAGVTMGALLLVGIYSLLVYRFLLCKWAKREEEQRILSPKTVFATPYESKEDKLSLYLSVLGSIILPSSIIISLTILYFNGFFNISISLWICSVFIILWCWYVIKLFKGFGYPIIEKVSDDHLFHYSPRYKTTKSLQVTLENLRDTLADLREQELVVETMKIPIPPTTDKAEISPFVDYVKELSDVGKSHPSLASLEQLVLAVTHFPNLDGWMASLQSSIQATGTAMSAGAEHISTTVHNFGKFVSHPDTETWQKLSINVMHHLQDSGHSQMLKWKLSHSHNLGQTLGTLGKEAGKDFGKGSYETFSSEDTMADLKDALHDFKDSLEHLGDHFVPSIDLSDMNIFDPDFDFTAHFPLISTLKEAYINLDRLGDGDVDMGASLLHSATKIGGRTGGASLGSMIGTIFCPGVGTLIGGLVGAFAGGWLAKKINAQKFEELKERFEQEKMRLEEMVASSTLRIELKQKDVGDEITRAAYHQQKEFEKVTSLSPLGNGDGCNSKRLMDLYLYAFGCVIYDLIWEQAAKYSLKSPYPDRYKYNSLLSLLPDNNKEQYTQFYSSEGMPKKYQRGSQESLLSMIDGLLFLMKSKHLQAIQYVSVTEVVKMFIDIINNEILMLHTQHIGWLNAVQQNYMKCNNALLRKSEDEFKSLQDTMDEEQTKIKAQADKCSEIAHQTEAEKNTL